MLCMLWGAYSGRDLSARRLPVSKNVPYGLPILVILCRYQRTEDTTDTLGREFRTETEGGALRIDSPLLCRRCQREGRRVLHGSDSK
jgi:hypothetical protein